MDEKMRRVMDELEKDFEKTASKPVWDYPSDIVKMKDLQKLMYYIDVRCAMKEGNDYPGSEYMPDQRGSGRGRDSMGRYTSGRMSGMPYDMDMPSRRYYDSEKEKAIHKLHQMLENTDDESRKSALNMAIHVMEEMK